MSGFDDDMIPPIKAIRVVSCGKDWVTDTDATRRIDELRGFSLDDEGVHLYCMDRDLQGNYDNVFVPYRNLEAVVFYFNKPQKLPEDIPIEYFENGGI